MRFNVVQGIISSLLCAHGAPCNPAKSLARPCRGAYIQSSSSPYRFRSLTFLLPERHEFDRYSEPCAYVYKSLQCMLYITLIPAPPAPHEVPVRHRQQGAGSTPPESAHQRGPRGPSDPRGGRAGQAVVHTRTPTPDRRWPHDRGCRPPKASPPPLEHELRAPPGYRARLPLPLRAFGLRTGPGRSLTMHTRLPPAASPNASPCPSDELVLGSLRICASRRGAERYIVRIRRAAIQLHAIQFPPPHTLRSPRGLLPFFLSASISPLVLRGAEVERGTRPRKPERAYTRGVRRVMQPLRSRFVAPVRVGPSLSLIDARGPPDCPGCF